MGAARQLPQREIFRFFAPLAALAAPPLRLLVLMPALEACLALLRGVLVNRRYTRAVRAVSAVEIGLIALVLAVAVGPLGAVGVTAAAWALLLGRLAATALLRRACAAPRPAAAAPERGVARGVPFR